MPRISAESAQDKTGKTWDQWFATLDAAGARTWDHPRVAGYLATKHGLSGWWAQSVTVEYERARGKRAVGQRVEGSYEASVQRTLDASPTRVERAFKKARPEFADARAARTAQGRVLRVDAKGARVQATLTPLDDGRTRLHVAVTKLPSADARDKAKKAWTRALDALKKDLSD